jgi:predicted ABC-type transport system involved in lysophospholipase L1 biosynthesis ATPase subunit
MHRDYGLTSVIVTHNRALAAQCDRTVTLGGGRLIESGDAERL